LNIAFELKDPTAFQAKLNPYNLASTLHLTAATYNIFSKNDSKINRSINKLALVSSKLVNLVDYLGHSIRAFKKNRSLDAIAKFIEPISVLLAPIGSINLVRGIGSGLSTIDYSQSSDIKDYRNFFSNLKENLITAYKMAEDIYGSGLLGKSRKIFTKGEERGHTLAFSAHISLLSSILGFLFKDLSKYLNILRNFGAVLGNFITMSHPDKDKQSAGLLFNIYSVLDTLQKFMPDNYSSVINNLNMVFYNTGLNIFGNLSSKRSNGDFQDYEPALNRPKRTN
jgi:hypothetical protein